LPRKLIDSKPITTAEARKILEKASEDELGEFQRRTRDYTVKFSKIQTGKAEKLLRELSEKHELDRKDAIQVANCMPSSIEEIRTVLTIKGRVFTTAQLEDILKTLTPYRASPNT
jgi:DNA-directed RNA polymerase subunit F